MKPERLGTVMPRITVAYGTNARQRKRSFFLGTTANSQTNAPLVSDRHMPMVESPPPDIPVDPLAHRPTHCTRYHSTRHPIRRRPHSPIADPLGKEGANVLGFLHLWFALTVLRAARVLGLALRPQRVSRLRIGERELSPSDLTLPPKAGGSVAQRPGRVLSGNDGSDPGPISFTQDSDGHSWGGHSWGILGDTLLGTLLLHCWGHSFFVARLPGLGQWPGYLRFVAAA